MNIIDRTATSPPEKRVRQREESEVVACVLHATGFSRRADSPRWDLVSAHYIIQECGDILMLNHPLTRMNVGSGPCNAGGITIEHELNPISDRGTYYKPEKFGRGVLRAPQVKASRELLSYLCATYPIKLVIAHRHFDGKRKGNCPGPDIWRELGCWAIDNLGLTEPAPLPKGLPIPDSWRGAPRL